MAEATNSTSQQQRPRAPARPTVVGVDPDVSAARADALHALVDEQFDLLGEKGITQFKHALQFTNNLAYKGGSATQLTAECMFCKMRITSTGATRVVDHFLKTCVLVPERVKQPFAVMRAGTERKRKMKIESCLLVEQEAQDALKIEKAAKLEQRQQGLREGFGVAEHAVADAAIARFMYATGISFAAADTTPGSYYRQMVDAVRATKCSYVPPNPAKVAGPLLDNAYNKMQDAIKKRDSDNAMSERFGLTYTSDGWESIDNKPLINSAYIMANDGGVYMRSVDTSGMTKNGEYVANLMIQDIYEIGCTKVVCVVTDTCSTMRKAWKLVEQEFTWISCMPCQTHCPSLLLNDIGKISEVAETQKDQSTVVKWCAALPA